MWSWHCSDVLEASELWSVKCHLLMLNSDILWTSEHWLGICHSIMSTGCPVDVKILVSYMSFNYISFRCRQEIQSISGLWSNICHILTSIPDVLGTYLDVGSLVRYMPNFDVMATSVNDVRVWHHLDVILMSNQPNLCYFCNFNK